MYLWNKVFGYKGDNSDKERLYTNHQKSDKERLYTNHQKSYSGIYRPTTDTEHNIRNMTSYMRPSVLRKVYNKRIFGKQKHRCDYDSDTSSLSSQSTISDPSISSKNDEYEIVTLGRAIETEELSATITLGEEDLDEVCAKKENCKEDEKESCKVDGMCAEKESCKVGEKKDDYRVKEMCTTYRSISKFEYSERNVTNEPRLCLFEDDNTRVSLFPIKHGDVWNMYKRAVASFWTVDEVDLSRDLHDWKTKLSAKERDYIMTVLAFFLGADRLVNDNLLQNVSSVVQLFEAQYFYQFQIAVENIHTEMYNILIDTLIEDEYEKDGMFENVERFACIKLKYDWCRRWTDDKSVSFEERIIAFACVEGIFFSSSFAAIFWLKKRGLMHGLCFSNELISRDEGLHCDFAVMIYKNYTHHNTPIDTVRRIIREACAIEQMFVDEALPDNLVGLSRAQMRDYVAFISERLMIDLTGQPLNPFSQLPTNPLDFMENISLQGKTNFFERKVSEYRAAAENSANDLTATSQIDHDEDVGDYSTRNVMITMSSGRLFI